MNQEEQPEKTPPETEPQSPVPSREEAPVPEPVASRQGDSSAASADTGGQAEEPASPQPKEPIQPSAVEEDLDQEVEKALGSMSLMDVYGMSDEKADPVSISDLKDAVPGVNRGKVIAKSEEGFFVELGGKSQGFLPGEELDPDEPVEVGADIDVVIIRYDQRDGMVILSRKSAEQQLLRRNLRRGVRVEARVTGTNKGGLELDVKGLKAFMPMSQVDIGRVDEPEKLIGEKLICEVMQVDRGDKNLVLSRRKVQEKEQQEKKVILWQELEKGQLRHGVVRNVMDYGAFVDLGGVEGLLHVSEFSWARVKDPREILCEGQEIDVVILSLDQENERVSLSLRQAGADPWTTIEQKYEVGKRYQACITNLANFGAFAELEGGVEGLIPISEMSWTGRVRHPSDVVKNGDLVEVEVLKIDAHQRRISLSMKSLQSNPWDAIEKKYEKDQIYNGKVVRLTDFGVFVNLEEGIDGLIHISELSEKHVNKASEVVQQGQELQVKVLGVDSQNQRIGLTLKGLGSGEEVAEPGLQGTEPADPKELEKKKKKRPLRGGLSSDGWDFSSL